MTDGALFDVVAVDLDTRQERVLATKKDRGDAEAVVKFAILRRGVDQEFYKIVPRRAANA